jgi:hypothetical protein
MWVNCYFEARMQWSSEKRLLKKRCRKFPAEDLGVSPRIKNSPMIGGSKGLNMSFSALSKSILWRELVEANQVKWNL